MCFCSGKEFGRHKRGHAYRVEVSNTWCNPYGLRLTTLGLLKELHSYPIFTEDWGADE
jgi:transcriptional adapter 2-alpha